MVLAKLDDPVRGVTDNAGSVWHPGPRSRVIGAGPRDARKVPRCHDVTMANGGLVGRVLAGIALMGTLGIGVSGCSSGPSATANSLCGSVFGTPPPANEPLAVSTFSIKNGESSGNPILDQAASAWIKALKQHDTAAAATAEHRIVVTCEQLKIPLGTYPRP